MEQTNNTAPQGKGMGIAGFVLALIAFIVYWPIAGVITIQAALGGGYGLAIGWLVFSLVATLLSVMGMMKLGKTGGKRGLAITGMIIGLVATVFSVLSVLSVGKIQEMSKMGQDAFGTEFQKAMEDAAKAADTTMNAQ